MALSFSPGDFDLSGSGGLRRRLQSFEACEHSFLCLETSDMMSVLCLRLSSILQSLYIIVTSVWLFFGLILKRKTFAKYTVHGVRLRRYFA